MGNFNHLPNDKEVLQVGLYETDPVAVETFAKRIAKFNDKYISNIILDVEAHEKGDAQYPGGPHFKIRIRFPSPEVQDAFWLE